MPLLEIANLTVCEARAAGWGSSRHPDAARLVDAVTVTVAEGQVVAIVGENASGTLPLALALVGLMPVAGGEVRFDGHSLSGLSERKWRPFRRQMQVLFGDAFGALPPDQTVAQMLLAARRLAGDRAAPLRDLEEAMEQARLPMATRSRFPEDLEPGERQRAALARALLMRPRLLICHDYTRGLEAPVQAALLNRLADLRDALRLTLLVMTHDLAVADHLASEIHILSRGKIVESGSPEAILANPSHEYTRRLIAAAAMLPG